MCRIRRERGRRPVREAEREPTAARGGAFPLDSAFMGSGGRHPYTECSSKGTCDLCAAGKYHNFVL